MQEGSGCFVCSFTLAAVKAAAAQHHELLFVMLPLCISALHHGTCKKIIINCVFGAGIRSKSQYLVLFFLFSVHFHVLSCCLLAGSEVKTMYIVLVPTSSSAVRILQQVRAQDAKVQTANIPCSLAPGFHLYIHLSIYICIYIYSYSHISARDS